MQGYDSFLENTKNIDYVGTRLHGGMRALQHEKRTIILGIDNRAIELNKDYNIPVIEQKNLSDFYYIYIHIYMFDQAYSASHYKDVQYIVVRMCPTWNPRCSNKFI